MTTWHAPPDALVQFARAPESLGDVTASSIEQHLMTCIECRAVVAETADAAVLRDAWVEVVDRIDQPSHTVVEQALDRLGMPTHMARLVGATPQLRLAWLGVTALLALAAVAIARDTGSDTPFLVVAPLVPLGAVLLAFLPTEEPGGEAALATPMHGVGLLLRRVVAVLIPTTLILSLVGLAQPHLTAGGVLWAVPGLALALGALALSTLMRASTAAAALAVLWLVIVTSVSVLDGRPVPIRETPIYDPSGLLLALVVAALAATWLYTHRDSFSTMEVTW